MRLKLFLTTIVNISFLLTLYSCGNTQKTSNTEAAVDSESVVQESEEEQIEEEGSEVDAIDWNVVMREIVRNLPKETVHSHFQGKIGADTVQYYDNYRDCPYRENYYVQGDSEGDIYYTFSVLAVPYSDSDNVLVIATSHSGLDGFVTDMLKTMDYNLQTKQFSNISDKIPGIDPSAELLDLSWLSEHPDWIKDLKDNYTSCSTYELSSEEGQSKVTYTFNDTALISYIEVEMGETVPDWYDRLNLKYVWNGKTFELEKKK